MDPRLMRDLGRRLGELERSSLELRIGVVTDDSPLTVRIGGHEHNPDMRKLASYAPSVDDRVAVLTDGNAVLVLGAID